MDSIVKNGVARSAQSAVELLGETVKSWIGDSERGTSGRKIPEVDWRVKSLDFQETLQSRGVLERTNGDRSCLLCPDFDIHVSLFARLGTGFECV